MLFSETKRAALESVLFVSVESVSAARLSEVIDLAEEDVVLLLEEMMAEYAQTHHGIRLVRIAEGYRFVTKEEYATEVEKILQPHAARLSRAALETLSIIAYQQPIIRAEIERIRGVGTDRVLARLMEKDLICEVGRKQAPGRPILYGTTMEFLEYFGLESLQALPPLEASGDGAVLADLEDPGLLREADGADDS